MSAEASSSPDALEAKSPFELRLNQSSGSPESFVKKSLETGDAGFLHSFTTGSAVDGPGVRVVAWAAGCQWRCRYCHNPDTWKASIQIREDNPSRGDRWHCGRAKQFFRAAVRKRLIA